MYSITFKFMNVFLCLVYYLKFNSIKHNISDTCLLIHMNLITRFYYNVYKKFSKTYNILRYIKLFRISNDTHEITKYGDKLKVLRLALKYQLNQ